MAEGAAENKENFAAMNKSAFILGYSGATGKALVQELAKNSPFAKVVLIGRREVKFEDEALQKLEQKVIDFDKLDDHIEVFAGLDVGYCCLGTTKGKSGKEGFIKVDHDYVVNTAKLAKEGGCQHFHLVSSTGANKDSWLLYPKVKGQVEEELKTLEFPRLSIYRPGLLLTKREESRPAERVFQALFKPIAAVCPTAGSIPVTTLAKAMINAAVSPSNQATETFDNKAIHMLSGVLEEKKAAKKEKNKTENKQEEKVATVVTSDNENKKEVTSDNENKKEVTSDNENKKEATNDNENKKEGE